uniref:Uncharacterized protein n=1 Tax=Aegilops tauschii subsp. strangulata TaxID=200361 RepID=A0A453J3H2_AEGTS
TKSILSPKKQNQFFCINKEEALIKATRKEEVRKERAAHFSQESSINQTRKERKREIRRRPGRAARLVAYKYSVSTRPLLPLSSVITSPDQTRPIPPSAPTSSSNAKTTGGEPGPAAG